MVLMFGFKQNGETCHTSHAMRFIASNAINGGAYWTPRICDLKSLDYFLWGAVKEKYYENKSETIRHSLANISDVIAEI